jgi:hypothetical protein
MARKLGELPMFLVFNSRTESIRSSSVFTFYITAVRIVQFMYLLFKIVYDEDY